MMSLLQQIQYEAASDAPVSGLLRKCMILASRLNHEPLRNWVNNELNGYAPTDDLPQYRILRGITSKGNLTGFGGGSAHGYPLPHYHFPADVRKDFDQVRLRQGISSLEYILANGGTDDAGIDWPDKVISLYSRKFVQDGWNLISAHQVIPANLIAGVIDKIKNKILSFALEIEQENPTAGEALPGTKPVPDQSVNRIFNNNFYGSVNNAAINSSDFEQ